MTIGPVWRNVLSAVLVGAVFIALLEAPPADWFPEYGNVYMHYAFVIVPGVSALLAYVLLRGNVIIRLVLLNAAMALALVVNAVRLFITDPSGYANFGFFAMLVGSLCVVATAWFIVLHLAGKVIGHVRRAT